MRTLVLDYGDTTLGPLVAASLRRHLPRHLVSSAGFLTGGRRPPPKLRDAAARLGIDIEFHRSSVASPGLVSWAELILMPDEGLRPRVLGISGAGCISQKLRVLGTFASPVVARFSDPTAFRVGTAGFQEALELIVNTASAVGKLIAEGSIEANMAEQKGAPE